MNISMPSVARLKIWLLMSILSLVACGGGGGGSGGSSGSLLSVFGIAMKGVVSAGEVNIHPVVNGVIDSSVSFGSGLTKANGSYDPIILSGYTGGPLVVRITAATDNSTMMKCDLVAGCGAGVVFGDLFVLNDPNFELLAIIPGNETGSIGINASVISTVSASVALDDIANNSVAANLAINNANTSVTNRLGLIGRATLLEVIDITDPAAVAAASDDVIEFNLLNAAIIDAVLADGVGGLSIENALDNFVGQFVAAGGLADTETVDGSNATIAEILQSAAVLVDEITAFAAANGGVDVSNINTLETEIDASAIIASNSPPDVISSGLPSTGNGNDLSIVKAAVQDVRNLTIAVDTVNTQTFFDEIDLTSDLLSEDVAAAIKGMEIAGAAIINAYSDFLINQTSTTFNDVDSGLSIAVVFDGNGLSFDIANANVATGIFSVAGPEINATVSLSASAPLAAVNDILAAEADIPVSVINNPDGSVTEVYIASLNLVVNLSGLATTTLSSVEIIQGTVAGIALFNETFIDFSGVVVDETQETAFSGVLAVNVSNLLFDLTVDINQLGVASPANFNGQLSFDIDQANLAGTGEALDFFDLTDPQNPQFTGFQDLFTSSGAFSEIDLGLNGVFSQNGKSLSASLAVNVDGTGITLSCSELEFNDFANQIFINEDECLESEGIANFIDIAFTLIFGLDIAGVDDDIAVEVTGTRTGLETGSLSAEITYADATSSTMFDIEYDSINSTVNSETVTILNQAGVVVTVTETEDALGALSTTGNIVVNGTEYATIDDTSGFIVVNYNDGTFESL